jgi:4-diphosphocytidyl-2-C-methyl-D-erythritol kinase
VNDTSLTLPSFAKINWSLRILGKRPDDFHEIVTLLQTVSLHDQLTLALRDDEEILITCNYPGIPVDDSNLVVRAAFALRDHLQVRRGADIQLKKRIPVKGGLGGASSNAMAALLGLNALWQTKLELSELISISSRLGADVPFFFIGGRALGEGIGTRVSALPDRSKEHIVIVTPNASVSTAAAYRAVDAGSLTTTDSDFILTNSSAEAGLSDYDQWPLHNDFEDVIFEIEPEIKRVKQALLEAGARGALLAGSGSSVFGIFDNEKARERALDSLRCEDGWRIFPCETLSRDEYYQAMGSSGFPLLRSL